MSQRQDFVINSPGPRGATTAVVLTLVFIVAWHVRKDVDAIVAGALVLWLLVILARRRAPKLDATARLKLELLRARLAAADMAAVLKDPDMAHAARDYAAGRISAQDYETALRVAGDEARQRRDDKARHVSRFRFR